MTTKKRVSNNPSACELHLVYNYLKAALPPGTVTFIEELVGDIQVMSIDSSGALQYNGPPHAFWEELATLSWKNPHVVRHKLKTMEIPEGVSAFGADAFSKCDRLQKVVIPGTVKKIEMGVFAELKATSTRSSLEDFEAGGRSVFSRLTTLTEIEISEGVETIGRHAFVGCNNLKRIVIPKSVKTIESSAFAGCSSLTDVVILGDVDVIECFAFAGCSSLTNVVIWGNVDVIKGFAFYSCYSLSSVVIEKGFPNIKASAFKDCASLAEVVIPEEAKVDDHAFSECPRLEGMASKAGSGKAKKSFFKFKNPFSRNARKTPGGSSKGRAKVRPRKSSGRMYVVSESDV